MEYQKNLKVPDGFDKILRDFSREVLRHHPADILAFGAEYFEKLTEERGVHVVTGEKGARLSGDALREHLIKLFTQRDPERAGCLPHKEFMGAFEDANLNLSTAQKHVLLAEADEDDAEMVYYEEFVERAVDIIDGMGVEEEEDGEDDDILVRGLNRAQFQAALDAAWTETHGDSGSSVVSRGELGRFLEGSDLGFTRREVNVIMQISPTDERDRVWIQRDVMPKMWEILVNLGEAPPDRTEEEWKEWIRGLVAEIPGDDRDMRGRGELRDLLRASDIGLTSKHVLLVLSEVPDEDGRIATDDLAAVASSQLVRWFDPEEARLRAEIAGELPAITQVHHLDRHALETSLQQAFLAVDGEGKGVLKRLGFRRALASSSAGLTTREIGGLLTMAEPEKGDEIAYERIVEIAFDILAFFNQESRVDRALEKRKV